jgi:hypothetical protein
VNGGEEKDLKCGRRAHGFFTKTMRQHTTHCLVKTLLAKHKIPMLGHPPYSPDLALCDFFFLFPKIKSPLQGTHFKSIGAVKAKATEIMKKLSEKDLQHCFQQWKICMELCRGRGRDHFHFHYVIS